MPTLVDRMILASSECLQFFCCCIDSDNNTTATARERQPTPSKAAIRDDLERQYTERLEELRAHLKALAVAEQDAAKQNPSQVLDKLSVLDAKLVEYVVLYEGTPRGLAEFAVKSPDHLRLLQSLFSNPELMKDMLLADSPNVPSPGREGPTWFPAQYGPAMKIYQDIVETSEHLSNTTTVTQTNDQHNLQVLKRLALAIALEHAVPVTQENPQQPSQDNADQFVDPVRRFLNYESAFLEGHLDAVFPTLTVWELRRVIDGAEPEDIHQWGREMLGNYRPDHILTANHVWRYVGMVNSNVRYGSQNVKYDRPNLQRNQNILMNGGVCGRRAFFGRFILRSFGIPTIARPCHAHASLAHYTPDGGWVINLGPAWGKGWTKTRYQQDLDFLATTKARTSVEEYWKVKRAQWIGDVCEETRVYGDHNQDHKKGQPPIPVGFWYGISLQIQKAIIDGLPNQKVPPRQCPANHNKPTLAEQVQATPTPANAKTIQYDCPAKGTITIPAASFDHPRQTKDVQVMKSFQDCGNQIYLPDFQPQGLAIMRGGTWKKAPDDCTSGRRLKSGGYGQYPDWGFRVAITGSDDKACPNKHLAVDLGKDDKNNSVTMDFIYIPPGTFLMGGDHDKDGRFECVEVPKHKVTLTKGFYLGKYPVTQAQYQVIIGTNPSKSTKAPDCPVDSIGESDAHDYCGKLVETIGKDFRLPTEAEWEYAARGNQGDLKWFFGNDSSLLGDYAWFKDNSGGKSHPVGQKKPNPFGIYDLYGNVTERVSDKYAKDYYAKSPPTDPVGPLQGTKSTFEYTVKISSEGKYLLTAQVVTANSGQRLNVSANGSKAEIILTFPFTNGYWQTTSTPVSLSLQVGPNTIRFWREKPPQQGIAIKSFTIVPVAAAAS